MGVDDYDVVHDDGVQTKRIRECDVAYLRIFCNITKHINMSADNPLKT